MNKRYNIFISYRREGGLETARYLYELLNRDGYSVSFDLDTLRNGDFDKALLGRIAECTDLILICDRDVFKRTLDKNCKKKNDWLRIELAEAIKLNKNIIPIMLNGFNQFPENLPSDISHVRYKNGPKYDAQYFEAFYERLKHFFLEAPTEDIRIDKKTHDLETSLLMEHGWLCYNQQRYNEALEFFLKAADKGSANAINAIALYYYEGLGHERHLQKAAQWFKYAADMGYASAQRNYADCLRKGEGIRKNEVEAFSWYLRAAEKDNIKSQHMVGECYLNGWGIDKDLNEARQWFQIAADQGYEPSKQRLNEMETELK